MREVESRLKYHALHHNAVSLATHNSVSHRTAGLHWASAQGPSSAGI